MGPYTHGTLKGLLVGLVIIVVIIIIAALLVLAMSASSGAGNERLGAEIIRGAFACAR